MRSGHYDDIEARAAVGGLDLGIILGGRTDSVVDYLDPEFSLERLNDPLPNDGFVRPAIAVDDERFGVAVRSQNH
ncbi:hypothetical protein D9M72_606610 [compost metagenome]